MDFRPNLSRMIIAILIFVILGVFLLMNIGAVCDGNSMMPGRGCQTIALTGLPIFVDFILAAIIAYLLACILWRKNGNPS